MKVKPIEFKNGSLNLEGVWHLPEGTGPFAAIVVCHPHPLYGGNMDNNVVLVVCKAALIESVAVLRFNFRGVGRSGGKFDAGIGEQLDLEAALDFVARQPQIDSTKMMVAGYSFGGAVALAVAVEHELVKGIMLISPGIDEKGWQQFKTYRKSKFVMLGENDTAVPYRGYEIFFGDNTEYIIIAGADHSWWGYEDEVERQTIKFFVKNAR